MTPRPRRLTRIAIAMTATLAAATVGTIVATSAEAGPKGETKYPAGATATRFAGLAFDVCAAPELDTMRAWLASPYRAIGVYVSGELRACRQPNLTASWVRQVSEMGWKLIPIDVGRQAPCTSFSQRISTSASTAKRQGEDAAAKSVAGARRLDLLPGSTLYADIEHYSSRNAACSAGVRAYLDGWTRALHAAGYLSGVYGNLPSAMRDVASAQKKANDRKAGPTEPLQPDVLWNAQWDEDKDLKAWDGVPQYTWAAHQRIKQYKGDHKETHGGHTLTIDSNTVDAAVATVPYRVTLPAGANLAARVAPLATAAAAAVPVGAADAVCVAHSSLAPATAWVQLSGGSWLPVSVVQPATVAEKLPTCANPYPVQPGVMPLRDVPSDTAYTPGGLAGGTLAWIVCEIPGPTLGRPGYWLRLETGQWISGAHVERSHRYDDAPATPACAL